MPSITLPPELDRVLRDYEKAWTAKDPAGLAALFADDGFVMSNGRPAVRGRDAIRAAYSDAGGPLALRAFAWATEGTTGYIIGGFAMSSDKPDMGKFILALKRGTDGQWLIAADIDNANMRPRPPAPPAPAAPAAPPAPPAAPAPPAPPAH
jgi:ketosteroid isomerase-like protein